VSHAGWPIREDAADADILRQNLEQLEHVPIVGDGFVRAAQEVDALIEVSRLTPEGRFVSPLEFAFEVVAHTRRDRVASTCPRSNNAMASARMEGCTRATRCCQRAGDSQICHMLACSQTPRSKRPSRNVGAELL
jgi:hypothetical protein